MMFEDHDEIESFNDIKIKFLSKLFQETFLIIYSDLKKFIN